MENIGGRGEMREKKSVIIKFGGSVLYNNHQKLDVGLILTFKEVVRKILDRGIKVAIVSGGGILSRNMVSTLQDKVRNLSYLDTISLKVTLLHAMMVRMLFDTLADNTEFHTYEQVLEYNWNNTHVPILGGLCPGQSSNGTATLVTEILDADILINCFGFDHISDKNPEFNSNCTPLHELTYEGLDQLIDDFKQAPGHYELFDKIALNIVRRSDKTVFFVNGRKPLRILKFLKGEIIGTCVGSTIPQRR